MSLRIGHWGCGWGGGLCSHGAIFHLNVLQHAIESDSRCRSLRLRGFWMEGEGACVRQSLRCSIRGRRHGSRVRLTSRVRISCISLDCQVRSFSESGGVGCHHDVTCDFQPCWRENQLTSSASIPSIDTYEHVVSMLAVKSWYKWRKLVNGAELNATAPICVSNVSHVTLILLAQIL
jgi:hypothetical protein